MMYLYKNVTVIDPKSPWNNKTVDLGIDKNGIIVQIESHIASDQYELEFKYNNKSYISKGWIDLGTHGGSPGNEQKETVTSLLDAAAFGGFTRIAHQPDLDPVLDDIAHLRQLLNLSKGHIVNCIPLAALTEGLKGEEITSMLEFVNEGFYVFSNALQPIKHLMALYKALLYVKPFNGVVLLQPNHYEISSLGKVHEGEISTQIGLKGQPRFAELIGTQQAIAILSYTNGCGLHFEGISSEAALLEIEKNKDNLPISAGVLASHLIWDHTAIADFDTNFKVIPPLKSAGDRTALLAGLKKGTISTISSGHMPQNLENKDVEFDNAGYGMGILEHFFPAIFTYCNDEVSLETLINAITYGPAKVLKLTDYEPIAIGNKAELTWFTTAADFEHIHKYSKGINHPLDGATLKGKVLGIFNANKFLNQ